ncbi:MAG: glutamate 5-kinase [Acidobacteria bacterium]|nr:MAG: glutamate 5-kinase [Acidobacteriota bacterium]
MIKIGTSSITRDSGALNDSAVERLVSNVAVAARGGWSICLVSSGAIAAGLPALGLEARPDSVADLQVLAAIGQGRLMQRYTSLFDDHGIIAGQVLLSASDFGQRVNYLNARQALDRMTELGVLPIVNENDTVAIDEIKFGDNDRLAALVAHLIGAEVLVMLTDIEGFFTADPRLSSEASLIEEIVEFDRELEAMAGGAGTDRARGGMASKLAAARIASWSGVRTVIASAGEENVVSRVLSGESIGTSVQPHSHKLTSRKVWIAFGAPAAGRIVVDAGAKDALSMKQASLLPVGVLSVEGAFAAGDAVELIGPAGEAFAKGLSGIDSAVLADLAGMRTEDLPNGIRHEVIHRDDLVVLPGGSQAAPD